MKCSQAVLLAADVGGGRGGGDRFQVSPLVNDLVIGIPGQKKKSTELFSGDPVGQ